jgi:hypothetical protein
MDLIDKIKDLAARIPKQMEHIQTEEATKNAFIMPFISALGYDVFNPMEVIPEFTSDVGTKKGEKVDYAIKKDDGIIILIECKWSGSNLQQEHATQLYRYFSVTEARFAILTNGIEYEFYSDIDEPNRMDSKPFFKFNILSFQDHQVAELKKFTKSAFSLDDILTTASTLKYAGAVKKILESELNAPSEAFVRFFASQIFDGRLTKGVIDQFTQIVKDARKQFINERINERLASALSADGDNEPAPSSPEMEEPVSDIGIVTTEDEIEGFHAIKAILRDSVDVSRVTMRDTKSYCGVLLDDNNRKPICRLHFNSGQKYVGLFTQKNEERIAIDSVDSLYQYADRLKSTVLEYQ